MSYKDKLHSVSNDNQKNPLENRALEISNDLRGAFSDGTMFGEIIANSFGEILSKAIEKSGLDAMVNGGIGSVKNIIQEGVVAALRSDEFTSTLGQTIARNEIIRDLSSPQDFSQERGKEIGA